MSSGRRALLSVFDKSGLAEFAQGLAALGFELISTGGTLAALREAGLEARSVSDVTDFPEILAGRVKTLHPRIFGGILARRALPDDMATLDREGIGAIDLVVVNLYPFGATVAADPAAFDACLEKIDVGGPSMLRAAAKSLRDVTVVCDSADYEGVLAELRAPGGVALATRQRLAGKVFQHTSSYDAAIANYLAARAAPERGGRAEAADDGAMPAQLLISVSRRDDLPLKYGENPHQLAALYADDAAVAEPAITATEQLQGSALGYNNYSDGEAALEIVRELAVLAAPGGGGDAAVTIVKHANPCGAALGATVAEAYAAALACDPVSAFGGIVAASRPIDAEAAAAMKSLKIDVILAPGFTPEARELLAKKKTTRLLQTAPLPGTLAPRRTVKSIVGGYLVQELDRRPAPSPSYDVVTKAQPTAEDLAALWFAWTVAKNVKSNAIVYTSARATLGIGAGQMSRVDSARFGALKAAAAGLSLRGSYLASDAFFPFRDGVDVAADAGVRAIVQPGGSIRDEETIAAADERGLVMIFTARRHFRH